MEENRRKEAIDHIMSSLEDGYLDLGLNDQDELAVIKEAMDTLKFVDQWNDVELMMSDWMELEFTEEKAREFAKNSNVYI